MTKELKRILYVEDEPDIQVIAQLALEVVGGFEVNVCSSGEEALNALPAFQPDLILLDVMMPGMDGPKTLAAVKQLPEFKDTPVIFMTAKVQRAEVEGFIALGAIDVIPKPFDPMLLAEQINDTWQQWCSDQG